MSLLSRLIRHEGTVKDKKTGLHIPYKDSEGYLTIGYGALIDQAKGGGLYDEEAEFILNNRIHKARQESIKAFPWFNRISMGRQEVIIELVFNMGLPNLMTFKKMLTAAEEGNWEQAAYELQDSKYAKQVGYRADELADMLVQG